MTYNDAELQIAAIVANFDIPVGMSVGRYMELHPENGEVQRIREISTDITGSPNSYDNWRIVGVGDDQHSSGMYGYMIDDGQGGAIFSFRGSEGYSSKIADMKPEQLVKDWLGADLGLLNSPKTAQQAMAEEFVNRMYSQYGDQYDSFAFTGHSLGGNLAIDAAINAPDGMRDKIFQITGFDSPGFSDEYWLLHADKIKEMEGRINHYQWSAIGALLNTPGHNRTVEVRDMMDCLNRHALSNLDTSGGYVKDRPGGLTADERAIREIAEYLEHNPFSIIAWGLTIDAVLIQIYNEIAGGKDSLQVSTVSTTEGMTDFEINVPAVHTLEERYGEVQASLLRTKDLLDEMGDTLKYSSRVSWIVRNKLKEEGNRFQHYADILQTYRDTLLLAASTYQTTDNNVAEMYDSQANQSYGIE